MSSCDNERECVKEVPLPGEVRLRILEYLGFEPPALLALMQSSRAWYYLIKDYERSLSTSFTSDLSPENIAVVESSPKNELRMLQPKSFAWAKELNFRNDMLAQLFEMPLLSIRHGCDWLFDTRQVCVICQENRFRPIKEMGLRLMLELSDARRGSLEGARVGQEAWVHSRAREELGYMLIVSWIASRGYNYAGMLAEGETAHLSDVKCVKQEHRETIPDAEKATQSPEGFQNEVELQCVYREMALRYGPYFIWASGFGNRQAQTWVRQCMKQGLEDLRLYERGIPDQPQGLQAVIFNAILEKSDGIGGRGNGWISVMDLVYEMMARPRD